MTAASAAQWATLLVILAVFCIALGLALPSRVAHIAAAVASGVAVVLYLIAILA